jgi:hypothetical protein
MFFVGGEFLSHGDQKKKTMFGEMALH